ncbi:MAG: SCO family protein [Chloroflexi bacterium]|nr:MAG: SCO family protein [Chloroflexota bacterium]
MTATAQPIQKPEQTSLVQIITRYFYVLVILGAIGIVLFVVFQPITVLPRIALAPGFALVDQNNKQLTNEDMRGRIALYSFTYSNCVDNCVSSTPLMEDIYTAILKMDTGDIPVELITISIDPDDTPDKLMVVSDSLGANSNVWHFLTGTEERVRWVIGGGFSTFYKELDDGSYQLAPDLMLVDGAGVLRAEYRRGLPEFNIVMRDIGLLVDEAHNSDGVNKYAYEAAHLFLCYPR